MKDYRVKITIKNNKLLSAIEELGYTSVIKFSEVVGISPGSIYELLNMKKGAYSLATNKLRPVVESLCLFLGKSIEDIFPVDNIDKPLKTNHVMLEMDKPQVGHLLTNSESINPLKLLEDKEQLNLITKCLNQLDPRHAECIRLRFGLGCEPHTYKRIGELIPRDERSYRGEGALTTERTRQIMLTAMRKLRYKVYVANNKEGQRY